MANKEFTCYCPEKKNLCGWKYSAKEVLLYNIIYSNVGIIIMVLEAIGHGLLALNINEP
jgi:hypothetical protein